MRIHIFKGGEFNGTRISRKEFDKIAGKDLVKKLIWRLTASNEKDPMVVAIQINIAGIKYQLVLKEVSKK